MATCWHGLALYEDRPLLQYRSLSITATSGLWRMKVGVIVPGFSADAADWCIPVLVDVVRELTDYADVHVFALRYPYRRDRYRVHGAEVHALGGGTVGGARRLGLLAAAATAILAEHHRGAFDVLHGLWADEPGFTAVLLARLLRIPGMVSVMGGELIALPDIGYGGYLSRSNCALSAIALRGAGQVTAGSGPSVELTRRLLRSFGRKQGADRSIEKLVWGIDPTLFQAQGHTHALAGKIRVLHVGSLVPVKDQDTLFRAMARVQDALPGVHLHLLGDGPLRAHLTERVRSLGLTPSVTFHGHVNRGELGPYYRSADVLVISSRHEAQSVVTLEAALCQTPIVGTAVGLVTDFAPEAAIAVPIGDDRALAGAICAAVHRETGRKLAAAAQQHVESKYLAAHTARHLMTMYRQLTTIPE